MARSKNAKEVEVLVAPEIGRVTGTALGLSLTLIESRALWTSKNERRRETAHVG
jgi:hypothetical protein